MKKMVTIDAETDPFRNGETVAPFLWGYYDGALFKSFHDTEDFVKFIKKQNVIAYAHNGGKFDFIFLLPWIKGNLLIINSRVVECKIGKCTLRDSYALMPVPLSKFNKTKIDYGKFKRDVRQHHMREIESYLSDDCRFLYEALQTFFSEWPRKLTAASSAFTKCAAIEGWPKIESNRQHHELITPYYYGGRTQAFKTGHIAKPVKVYDINSAYPAAMLHDHPVGEPIEYLNQWHEDADFVSVVTQYPDGVFPHRTKSGLSFPDYTDEPTEFHITKWEFDEWIERTNRIPAHRVIKSYVFPERINMRKYVEQIYAIKQSATGARRIFAKLMLNSVYGKFAQNPDNYEEWRIAETVEDGWFYHSDVTDNSALMSRPSVEERYRCVATAASITGFVRAQLARSIDHETVYCDTDSIFTTGSFFGDISNQLGAWSLEYEAADAWIAGKKLYALKPSKSKGKWKTASKGVRLTSSQIKRVAEGKTITYTFDAPQFSFRDPVQKPLTRDVRMIQS